MSGSTECLGHLFEFKEGTKKVFIENFFSALISGNNTYSLIYNGSEIEPLTLDGSIDFTIFFNVEEKELYSKYKELSLFGPNLELVYKKFYQFITSFDFFALYTTELMGHIKRQFSSFDDENYTLNKIVFSEIKIYINNDENEFSIKIDLGASKVSVVVFNLKDGIPESQIFDYTDLSYENNEITFTCEDIGDSTDSAKYKFESKYSAEQFEGFARSILTKVTKDECIKEFLAKENPIAEGTAAGAGDAEVAAAAEGAAVAVVAANSKKPYLYGLLGLTCTASLGFIAGSTSLTYGNVAFFSFLSAVTGPVGLVIAASVFVLSVAALIYRCCKNKVQEPAADAAPVNHPPQVFQQVAGGIVHVQEAPGLMVA